MEDVEDAFAGLTVINIAEHGDARERDVWAEVAGALSNYEAFWRALIVLLTNRIVPNFAAGPEWIRIRTAIPVAYEQLAMHNYSLFYDMAMAHRAIEEDRKRLASEAYPRPEQIFFAMQASVEHSEALQRIARQDILLDLGLRWKFPKHPQRLYETIGLYRNAFAHDPVLGRAAGQGRELLPAPNRLPKDRSPFLWRDAAGIPTAEMIDGLKLEDDLWQELSQFLQAQWASLTNAFVEARNYDKFIMDLGLSGLLPIRCEPVVPSLAGPMAASGTIVARSDAR